MDLLDTDLKGYIQDYIPDIIDAFTKVYGS